MEITLQGTVLGPETSLFTVGPQLLLTLSYSIIYFRELKNEATPKPFSYTRAAEERI